MSKPLAILDVSAGNRGIWFNKKHPFATFLDIRSEVKPDVVADSRQISFPDNSYDLAVFDPPHGNFGRGFGMAEKYGTWTLAHIKDTISRTSAQLGRVLKPSGLLAFKWNDHDLKLTSVLRLMPEFEPLFGQQVSVRTLRVSRTYWVLLRNRKGEFNPDLGLFPGPGIVDPGANL